MSVQINNHPFYQDSRFVTEKVILERLTEICGFDTTIGVISYLPEGLTIEIGILEDSQKKDKIPSFKGDSKIRIYLNSSSKLKPFTVPQELSFETIKKVIVPIVQNWMEVFTFLIEFYLSLEKGECDYTESCLENLNRWKKEFTSLS